MKVLANTVRNKTIQISPLGRGKSDSFPVNIREWIMKTLELLVTNSSIYASEVQKAMKSVFGYVWCLHSFLSKVWVQWMAGSLLSLFILLKYEYQSFSTLIVGCCSRSYCGCYIIHGIGTALPFQMFKFGLLEYVCLPGLVMDWNNAVR